MLEVPYNDPKINRYSLPAALLGVVIAKVTVLPDGIFWYFFSIPMHEMGHTIAAWMGSRVALPLGALIPMAGQTVILPGKSMLVYLAMTGILGWLAAMSWREKKVYAFFFWAGALGLLNYLSWIVPEERWKMAMIYFGVGGEFALSTLLIVSFYYPMPEKLRWDFFRFVFLFVGVYCFVTVFRQWLGFSHQPGDIPWGSFINGGGDAGGDMAQLRDVYRWSPREIVESYLRLGKLGIALVLGHYFVFFWQKAPAEASASSAVDLP